MAKSLVRKDLSWAGLYVAAEGKTVVRIDVNLLSVPETLIATYAHELSHVLLLGGKRICADDLDHEYVTDLNTVFFGLGVFNANDSYLDRYRENRRGETIGRLGYLHWDIWAYALALYAWLRGEPDPDWATWLRPGIRSTFRKSLKYLTRTDDATVVEGVRST